MRFRNLSTGLVSLACVAGVLLLAGVSCALHAPARRSGTGDALAPADPTVTRDRAMWATPRATTSTPPARPFSTPGAVGRDIRGVASPTPTPTRVQVFLDPGHGGVDTGAIGITEDGTEVDEKAVALAIALRTADRLRHDGISVALSRTDDSLPGATAADYTADGSMLTPQGVLADLQRRVDRANASGARLLLSIHLNAFDDPSERGTETLYDSSRPFAARSERFAELIQTSLMRRFRAQGWDTPDRGVVDDLELVTDRFGTLGVGYHHLVMLGPGEPGILRPSMMPGALSESLFLSNPAEATAAARADVQDLIASAYTQAIEQFLRENPS